MDYKLFFSALGLALVFEGVPYFLSPEKMRSYIEMIRELPDNVLRTLGIASISFGLLVIYLARYIF
ncbi:MAG: DUF2065 domain-containing protein [bacterium]